MAAILLPSALIEYRVEPLHACNGSIDAICMDPDQILFLGYADIDPPPGSVDARFHAKIAGGNGLFARFGLPPVVTAICGMLIPLIMLIAAIVLVFRRSSPAYRTVAT